MQNASSAGRKLTNEERVEVVKRQKKRNSFQLAMLSVIGILGFSSPPTMRSMAARKSSFDTNFLLCRAAISAASLQTLAMSAPEKPGV